jgi:hypothetical protein
VTLVLLGTALDYTTHHLPPEIEVVQGEADINWPNQVMTVGWADQVFVVVAPDDENLRFARVLDTFRQRRADVPQNYLFGVFQPVVACGAGACQVCMVRTLDGTRLACTEGPAFDLTKVVLS